MNIRPDKKGRVQLSDLELKTTMINILRALIAKIDSMHEHMGNVSREMEILKKHPRRNARDKQK